MAHAGYAGRHNQQHSHPSSYSNGQLPAEHLNGNASNGRMPAGNGARRFYRISRLLFNTLFVIARERIRVMRARARGAYDVQPDVSALRAALREFRTTALEMGGLLIKLGQFLSSRADLLPPEALDELASLADEIPPADFEGIKCVIERELGAPVAQIFAAIDPAPAGSASLGQVHRARMHDGRTVAVKVQRPGIEGLLHADLRALRFVLETARRLAPAVDAALDLRGLYREFSRTLYEELDYEREAYSIERFARLFAEEVDIRVPDVIWSHTKRRVLTLEWISGIKLTDIARLDAACVDRRAVAKRILEVYFRQMLEAGFFHADPHAGNIFVQPLEGGFRLAFVDFGMMGTITPAMKSGMRDWFLGIVEQDARRVVKGLDTVGFLGEGADREVIVQAVELVLHQFSALPLGQIRHMDLVEILSQIQSLLYGQPLRLPAQFAMLGRTMSMLVGLASALSPTFSFLEVAKPYARRFLQFGGIETLLQILGVEDMRHLGKIVTREGLAMARGLAALPRIAERVLEHAERGELRIVLEAPALTNPQTRDAATRRVWRALLGRSLPAWLSLGLSGLFALLWYRERRRGR